MIVQRLSVNRRPGAICIIALHLALLGCHSARFVRLDDTSGFVVVDDSSSAKSREKAVELMASHFPEGYVIDFEREHITGTYRSRFESRDEEGNLSDSVAYSTNSEYQIHCHSKACSENSEADSTASPYRNSGFFSGGEASAVDP